jgi:metal-responsive CopG/Arc/MetJ family transcriptional regulator
MKGTTVWLPKDLVEIVDKFKKQRCDPTRSDTVRFLLLKALAEMSLLPEETKKALGVTRNV